MRIGFRHCLLSSCLFRCGAGWLRWDGKAVCGYGASAWVADAAPAPAGSAGVPTPAPLPPGLPAQPPRGSSALPPAPSPPAAPRGCPGHCPHRRTQTPLALTIPLRSQHEGWEPRSLPENGTAGSPGDLPAASAAASFASSASEFAEVKDAPPEKCGPARRGERRLVAQQSPADPPGLSLRPPELGRNTGINATEQRCAIPVQCKIITVCKVRL